MAGYDDNSPCSMILLLGVTGAGKSYFVNKLVRDAVVEGTGLKSETPICQVIKCRVGKELVAIVDTPGFDDSHRSDSEILDEICTFLVYQYRLGISLKGIVYMHRITDNKMQGSARRYFEVFQRICGEGCFGNIVLLTTMWDQLRDRGIGLKRDQELRDDYWNVMAEKGSQIRSYDGSTDMAVAIVYRMMRKASIVLDIQRELVDEGKMLEETVAGKLVVPNLEDQVAQSVRKIEEIDKLIACADGAQRSGERTRLQKDRASQLEDCEKKMSWRKRLKARPGRESAENIEQTTKLQKWKDRVTIFSSLVGLALSTTINVILPLAGVISF